MSGGSSNVGTLFCLAQDGSAYTVLKSFQGSPSDGAIPAGDLIQATNGLLYGATQSGGTSNLGTLFMLNKDGSGYRVLRNFTGVGGEGTKPAAGLIQGVDGALYGTTTQGGSSNQGTIFVINPDGSGFQVLRSFTGALGDGAQPSAALVQGPDGALCGTTFLGGAGGKGTVFKINPDGTSYQVLQSFGGTSGSNPGASLIVGTNGALYGTTIYLGTAPSGTVFQLNPDGTGFLVLKSFSSTGTDGRVPRGHLLQASDGIIYGNTQAGGTSSGGTVFRISPTLPSYAVLVNFNDTGGDGINPHAPLIEGTGDILYGTTQQGGTNGQGTIFKIGKEGTDYAILKSFHGNGDGANPVAGLLQGSDGALYGTTAWDSGSGGIVNGNGAVFRINPDGSAFQVLHHFGGGSDGANPLYGTLIQATDGLLYGSTMNGGTSSLGTVFRIGLNGSNYLVIKRFGGGSEGYHPYGGVIQAVDGALYGTTSIGGVGSQGTIFRMNLDGTGFTTLHSFSGPDGAIPYAGLIQAQDGVLYGTTETGGSSGTGVVFKLHPDGSGYAVLKSLDVNSGTLPLAPLIQGANGVLCGTASSRGNTNSLLGAGTVFQLNTDGSGFRVLKVFTQTGEGNSPYASLWQSSDGTLFGAASNGGRGGNLDGTLFSLLPAAVLSLTTADEGVELGIAGLAGRTYRIQRSSTIAQPWADLGAVMTGSDGTGQLIDTNPPSASAFYRTVEP